jgi:hypothetical protein
MATDDKRIEETAYREWHAWQANGPARARRHEEKRQKTEIELLDGASTLQEFIRRRAELKSLVVEPDIPMDEMTMSDYMKMRDRGER